MQRGELWRGYRAAQMPESAGEQPRIPARAVLFGEQSMADSLWVAATRAAQT
jgi:hypothetical protein